MPISATLDKLLATVSLRPHGTRGLMALNRLFATQVDPILRPERCVICLSSEITQTRERRSIMFRGESEAGYQPAAIRLASVRTFNPPKVLGVVPQACLDTLIVFGVFADAPFLVDILEIATEFWPARISLLEVEVHIQLAIEELIDWRLAVDSSSWVTVPVPYCWTDRIVSTCAFVGSVNLTHFHH